MISLAPPERHKTSMPAKHLECSVRSAVGHGPVVTPDTPESSRRVSIWAVTVRVDGEKVPSTLRSDHHDRGAADRAEDRGVGALARGPAVAVQLGGAGDPGRGPRRQSRGDGHGAD